jgi:hypothetical protein
MTSSSAIINRGFRRHLSPVIREAGFEKVDARNGWAWKADCAWVLNVRAVGKYFSEVTGWPPASVVVSLGVYYSFIPSRQPLKVDRKGRCLPTEYQCHMRSHLERNLAQVDRVSVLANPAERKRKDIWWLDANGANAEEVSLDIVAAFLSAGVPWFARCTDLDVALKAIEAERDCFNKFVLATYVAGKLERMETRQKYATLAQREGRRIGQEPERGLFFLGGR